MLNLVNLMTPTAGEAAYGLYFTLSLIMIILMGVAALAAVILVLMQPSNSNGIEALGGSSETFFGKNKGKSIEEKLKKWTWICLAVLVVFALAFYVLQLEAIWA
ncbi:MAG: preprotein translocase subunit SecG [Clostridiales bacterium]|nr:preprotein translocase subunit SecG [Clostridiales bacterium]